MNCKLPASPGLLLSTVVQELIPSLLSTDACVVLALVLIMSTTWWLAIARKTYTGPKNLGGLLEMARAEMDDPTRFNPSSSDDEARVVPRSEKETKTEF